MDLQKVNKILFTILIVVLFSCDDKKYDSYQTVENATWKINHPYSFEVDVQEISKPHNVFLNIRTDKNYGFRNLFVISELTYPDGVSVQDTLEYEMADAFGNWLGDGITDVKNNQLYYLENFTFPEKGTYKFKFIHAMRKRGALEGLYELEGIRDIGLRIEELQN
ncbi:gliding motility lipoprotein GldH [Wenyingzhuangia sp. IMCC45574]